MIEQRAKNAANGSETMTSIPEQVETRNIQSAEPIATELQPINAEELNQAYDVRLKNYGIQVDTTGITMEEQISVKKQVYNEYRDNQGKAAR